MENNFIHFLKYKIERKKLVILILIIIGIIFFRWDFVYYKWDYKVQQDDTMWGILNDIYDDPYITKISLAYIKTNTQYTTDFDINKILRNEQGQGGNIIRIFNNQMTVIGPDNNVVVKTQILPQGALGNHFMQVYGHNAILIGFLIIVYQFLSIYKFQYNKEIRNIILIAVLVIPIGIILIPIILGIIYILLAILINILIY